MAQQIAIGPESHAEAPSNDDGTHAITADLAFQRHAIVNVVYWGRPGAGDREWVLIDAGVMGSGPAIRAAAASRFGPDSRPAAIVLTHGHFDHVGAVADLARAWDVPVYAHPLEHPYLDGTASYPKASPEVGGGAFGRLSALFPRHPIDIADYLRPLPKDGTLPSMPGWRWIHTPGHSVGHVSLWNEADGTLIAGDAFVTTAQESVYAVALQEIELHGPPMYFTVDWGAARSSVETLADLEPERVITGHGRPLHGPALRRGLRALADTFADVAIPARSRYRQAPARASDGSAYAPAPASRLNSLAIGHEIDDRRTAQGLAWLGIGLGAVELLAPKGLARAIGLKGHEATLQAFGIREIASGIAVLASDEPETLLSVRIAGDVLDVALLAQGLGPSNPRRGRTLAAFVALAPVMVLDTVCWLRARERH